MKAKNKKELEGFIEPHIYKDITDKEYIIERIKALDLLTWNRLDLAFKLLYLDLIKDNRNLAKEIYKEDIRVMTLGEYKEIGNKNKSTFNAYIKEFNSLYESIERKGFNSGESYLPLSKANTIINGAHRTAVAIHQNLIVTSVKLNLPIKTYDYNLYRQRCISENNLDDAVCKFIEYSKNTHLSISLQSNIKLESNKELLFEKMVYEKEIKLTSNGVINLLFELHKDMDKNNNLDLFESIETYVLKSLPEIVDCKILAFQVDNLEDLNEIKKRLNSTNEIELNPVYITDTKEQAMGIANLIFNENGKHFLNYVNQAQLNKLNKKINTIKKHQIKNNINPKDMLLGSNMVLDLYGIKKSEKINYIINNSKKEVNTVNENSFNVEKLKYYDETKKSLIFDSLHYFYYNNLKFISFEQVYNMKINRANKDDKDDCVVMKKMLKNISKNGNKISFKRKAVYLNIKIKSKIIKKVSEILEKLDLYSIGRKIYHRLKINK